MLPCSHIRGTRVHWDVGLVCSNTNDLHYNQVELTFGYGLCFSLPPHITCLTCLPTCQQLM